MVIFIANLYRMALFCAAILLCSVVGFASEGVIESDEASDPIPVRPMPVAPAPATETVPEPATKAVSSHIPLSGLGSELAAGTFEAGVVRPVSFSHLGGDISLVRVGWGPWNWFSLGLGKNLNGPGLESSQVWLDFRLRLISTDFFGLSLASASSLQLGGALERRSRPGQGTLELRFGYAEGPQLRLQSVAASNELNEYQDQSYRLARLGAIFEIPVAQHHFLSGSLFAQSTLEKRQYSYHSAYRNIDGSYQNWSYESASREKLKGVVLGAGYRFENPTWVAAIGVEGGPTETESRYQTTGSYAYSSDYKNFSILGMLNIAGTLAVKF